MLKKLLLRLIEANNVLEGGRWLVLKGVKKGVVCWSWFEKKKYCSFVWLLMKRGEYCQEHVYS